MIISPERDWLKYYLFCFLRFHNWKRKGWRRDRDNEWYMVYTCTNCNAKGEKEI